MEIINITAHRYQTADISELAADLVKFKAELNELKIKKDQNKTIKLRNGRERKFNYASFDNILNKVTPVLSKHNLSVLQSLTGEFIETLVLHSSGQFIGVLTPFEPMQNSTTSSMQNIGGGMTYISRYAYKAVLGLCLEDDTDGDEQVQQKPTFSAEWIEPTAKEYLKKGTIERLEKQFFIPEKIRAQIYIRASKIKEEIESKKAAKTEQINEPVNN